MCVYRSLLKWIIGIFFFSKDYLCSQLKWQFLLSSSNVLLFHDVGYINTTKALASISQCYMDLVPLLQMFTLAVKQGVPVYLFACQHLEVLFWVIAGVCLHAEMSHLCLVSFRYI